MPRSEVAIWKHRVYFCSYGPGDITSFTSFEKVRASQEDDDGDEEDEENAVPEKKALSDDERRCLWPADELYENDDDDLEEEKFKGERQGSYDYIAVNDSFTVAFASYSNVIKVSYFDEDLVLPEAKWNTYWEEQDTCAEAAT